MAVKVLNIGAGISGETLQHFKEEVDLQRRLTGHPNIGVSNGITWCIHHAALLSTRPNFVAVLASS